jgi:hypothetical protein
MTMKALVLLAAACAAVLALAPLSMAQTPADLSVGGVWVFKITQSAGSMPAETRVVEVRKRITEILSRYRAGQDVRVLVQPLGAAAALMVGDILVVTVTPADAAGTGVSTFELARQWARRLHQGLTRALPDATFHVF